MFVLDKDKKLYFSLTLTLFLAILHIAKYQHYTKLATLF
jgi:hypothetical protein